MGESDSCPCVRLNVLGRFEIRLDGGDSRALPTRKSEALLTYLALEPGKQHPRDRLINLFWSDRGEDQARNSLRHALSAIRKALAAAETPVVNAERTTVGAVAGAIALDAHEFADLARGAEKGSLDAAARLYHGDFLDGLVIRDPVGEEWLAAQRDHYRRLIVGVLGQLTERRRAAGALAEAVDAAERLVSLDPLLESAWQELMQVYAAAGDRNHALLAYRRCRDVLKGELSVDPTPETTALRDRIRDGSDTAPAGPVTVTASIEPLDGFSVSDLSLPDKPSIVVLPFTNLGATSDDDYLADAVTQDIIVNLACNRELFVIDPGSAFTFRKRGKDAESFAGELAVEYLVKGTLRRFGQQLRLSVQLVEVESGRNVWAKRVEGGLDELFGLQAEVADTITANLVHQVEDTGRTRARGKAPGNMTAYECLLRVRRDVSNPDAGISARVRQEITRAIELDPEYATAYAYFALNYLAELDAGWSESRSKALEKAIALAHKAVELDEFNATAHLALGWGYTHVKNFALAERHFDHAIELNPNTYDNYCYKSWMLALTGRTAECQAAAAKAFRLSPCEASDCQWALGVALYTDKRYAEALRVLDRLEGQSAELMAWRAACFAQLNHSEAAFDAARRAMAIGEGVFTRPDYPFANEQDVSHMLEGFRRAGLLDRAEDRAEVQKPDTQGELPVETNLHERISVAVLPFDNLSRDPDQDYFSHGLTEGIILGLSQNRSLAVVSRYSSCAVVVKEHDIKNIAARLGVRYLVEGSVRKTPSQIRVTAQLVDGESGKQMWGQRFNVAPSEIFTLEDEVTRAITATVSGRMEAAELESALRKPVKDLRSYDLLMRGLHALYHFSPENNRSGRELLEQCVAIEPDSAAAHTALYYSNITDYMQRWVDDPKVSFDRACVHARRAIECAPDDSAAHAAYAECAMFRAAYDEAATHAQRAIRLNPGNPNALSTASDVQRALGNLDTALELAESARRLDLYHPWIGWVLGSVYLSAGRYQEAIEQFRSMPNPVDEISGFIAACYELQGDHDNAVAAMQTYLELARKNMVSMPGTAVEWRAHWSANAPSKNPADLDVLIDALFAAGLGDLPEKGVGNAPA